MLGAKVKIKNLILLNIVLIISLLTSCNGNEHVIDTSGIKIDLKLKRFEQDLFNCKSSNDILKLKTKYPSFYPIFTNDIMVIRQPETVTSEQDVAVELYRYITHRDPDSLYKIAQSKFGDFSPYFKEIEEANRYIVHYFPEEKLSNVITFISAFEFASIYDEEAHNFCIGLDMYLGRNFEVYKLLNPQSFPKYRVDRFEPYHIVPNCIQSFLNYKIPESSHSTFIEQAIYEGKKMYTMDLILPKTPDSLKISYLRGQIEWNIAQEKNIWAYLIENEILFSSDKNDFQQHFFNDGPFTTPFGNESSPRAGVWVGWQIVKSYMKKHPEVTLKDLIANKDHNKIFQESGYKP